jgi:hypothetical protein
MPDGSQLTLDCLRSDRIGSLKERIEREKGIPRVHQLLAFKDRWLEDSWCPEDRADREAFEVPLWPTLDLIVCPPDHFPILIKRRDRVPFARVVMFNDRIGDIIQQQAVEFDISREYLRFQRIKIMILNRWPAHYPNPRRNSLDQLNCPDDHVPIFVQWNDKEPAEVVVHMNDTVKDIMNRFGEQPS